jgi:2,4-dienoyl-CoA reductase-like NADH-dependent reductase (Old Yellow Enzyme family)
MAHHDEVDWPAMSDLFAPMTFLRGPAMKNRFMLAPLTNQQSYPDGRLSADELHWLAMRARGGFGLTMTCAAHVQAQGQGFPGQLGIFGDQHLEGLTRLASRLRAEGSLAFVQLHHAGIRSPAALIATQPVGPSDNSETGARALTTAEIEQLTQDFIGAALRAEAAGFDGVELHGAHGYLLCQFLSDTINRRSDRYGGSLENRSRLICDILHGIRARARPDFTVGIRISPERFDLQLAEIRELAQRLMSEAQVDFIDLSLWDAFKTPNEAAFSGRPLLEWFTDLDRGNVRLGAAGKIMSGTTARQCLEAGADFVALGRAAILHHDFPLRVQADPDFEAIGTPVSAEHLRAEGLGPAFMDYMRKWQDFVAT